VAENAAYQPPAALLQVQAINRDEQQTGEFKIDEVTGELRARTQLNRKNRAK